MASQTTTSQIINNLKGKMKGAWDSSRKVEAKAKGFSTLPGGITNGVARLVNATLKMSEDKGFGSAPQVNLKFIVREPIEHEGVQTTKAYVFRDRKEDKKAGIPAKSISQVADDFANDLQLCGLQQGENGLPDLEDWPEMLADLASSKPYVIFKTWKPDNSDNVQFQLKRPCNAKECEAFAANPTDAPSDTEKTDEVQDAEATPAPAKAPAKAPPKGPPAKKAPPAAPAEEEVTAVDDEPVVADKAIPEVGDRLYLVVGGQQLVGDLISVDAENRKAIMRIDTVEENADIPVEHAGKKYAASFDKLEKDNPSS